jgi:DNA-binding response OmpR family regulator
VAGKEWRLRTLLRAQLIEEGFEVEAHETVENAARSLARSRNLPLLVVADLSESEQPLVDLGPLSAWAKLVPVWLLASRTTLAEDATQNRGFEKIFFRPIDLRALVLMIGERSESSPR